MTRVDRRDVGGRVGSENQPQKNTDKTRKRWENENVLQFRVSSVVPDQSGNGRVDDLDLARRGDGSEWRLRRGHEDAGGLGNSVSRRRVRGGRLGLGGTIEQARHLRGGCIQGPSPFLTSVSGTILPSAAAWTISAVETGPNSDSFARKYHTDACLGPKPVLIRMAHGLRSGRLGPDPAILQKLGHDPAYVDLIKTSRVLSERKPL
jgi:hypothetical protein